MDWGHVDCFWIRVMFLSAFFTFILVAPIHCKGFIVYQVNAKFFTKDSDDETNSSTS